VFSIRHPACLGLGFALLAWNVMQAQTAQDVKPKPLEFWHVGRDELSNKLADAVYSALAVAQDFVPSSGKQPGSLLVEIPDNVRSVRAGKRNKVTYTVNFSHANDQRISSGEGSCPENRLSVCADQILKRARIAAREVK
jgi:hypothetical protein